LKNIDNPPQNLIVKVMDIDSEIRLLHKETLIPSVKSNLKDTRFTYTALINVTPGVKFEPEYAEYIVESLIEIRELHRAKEI
jgi:hypothetical protein